MSTFTVTNLNDSGAGSLRAAITAANVAQTAATIAFAVTGTITLASDLPAISQDVTIDATSAPGYAGAPVVELNCNGNAGLVFVAGSDGSQLLGIAVGNAAGNGITLDAGTITLAGNYVGLGLGGTALGNSGDGVYVAATSSNNLIGANPTAAVGVVSNVISDNAGNGISLHGSSGNTLVANYIGTDPTGTIAMANGGNGIWLTGGADGNEIGGTAFTNPGTGAANDPTGSKGTVAPVFVVPPLGNLVSGNAGNGILIDTGSEHNVLNGNFVGTTAGGNSALGNALDGVAIDGADNNSLIGCQFVNNPFVYYNVVSGNGGNGLHVTDADNITVQGNFFGIGADNSTIVGNALNGILVDGTSQDVQVGGVIPLGNVAAGNGQNGIEVAGTASGFTSFNTFGGLFAFGGAAPNGNDGLLITATGGGQTVQTNVFSGNAGNGIEIGGDASGVTVDPNIAGLTTDGLAVLANGNDGIEIDGTAHDNTIGGNQASVIPQNTFSGNAGYGVAIVGQADDNQVSGDIGRNVLGTAARPNGEGGILIGGTAGGNTIADATIACFVAGTRIATPRGDVPVEALAAGDLVCVARGGSGPVRPIVWIGHRRLDCRRHPKPQDVWPVRVCRGAFARGVPRRTLWLSPDHAVFIDGGLIPVRCLVNGRTIVREPRGVVHYLHVELPTHDILLAERLPCESFLDTGNRADFDNGGKVVRLHPALALRAWATQACAPLVRGGTVLRAARHRLLERAAGLGHARTRDPDLRLVVDGRTLPPELHGRMHRFRVPPAARGVRLVSRSGIPAETQDDSTDPRRLGVAVSAAVLGGVAIPLGDPRLGSGWHDVEHGADGTGWRWTNGDAAIAAAGGQVLDIVLALTACCWLDDDPAAVRPRSLALAHATAAGMRRNGGDPVGCRRGPVGRPR